jgi:succinate-acetate transporter protein
MLSDPVQLGFDVFGCLAAALVMNNTNLSHSKDLQVVMMSIFNH